MVGGSNLALVLITSLLAVVGSRQFDYCVQKDINK